jgi:hypothetical protein
MAKNIRITNEQLEDVINAMRISEANDNLTLELGGDAQEPLNTRVKDTIQNARANGVDPKKVDVNIPNETALNCSKTYTKSQLLEARRKYLRENSTTFTKTNILKR